MNIVRLGPGYFPETAIGRPIANADIYVGIIDLDPEIVANQIQLSVQQEDGTIVNVAQPISTGGGGVPLYNGSPVTLLVASNYSLKVLDKNGSQVYYIPSVVGENEPPVSVKQFGAVGDGVTDDTDAINTALATGGRISADDGTFLVTGLSMTVSETSFFINTDATLLLADGSDTHTILVSSAAADCLITGGGTIDGNGDNQSSGNGIQILGDDCIIDGIKVVDAYSYGIHTLDALRPAIRNNTIIDSINIGIYVQNNTAPSSQVGAVIDGNYVDRTGISAATITAPGITSHGLDPDGFQAEIRYTNNHVRMPTEPTDATAVCMECWGPSLGSVFTGNITRGGSIGISVGGGNGNGKHSTVTGNYCTAFDRYGIEIAEVDFMAVTGNTINGGSLGATSVGIGTSGSVLESDFCTIAGNVIRNCTENAIQSLIDSDNLAITGNSINHAAATPAILLPSTNNTTINSNVINGLGTGTIGVDLRNPVNVTVDGNVINNFTTAGIFLRGTDANVVDNMSICGNVVTASGTSLDSSLAGGATLGNSIKARGNSGIDDYISFGQDIKLMIPVTATPEGSLTAGIGSTATDSANGLVYVKNSGTGNTGWKTVAFVL